MLILNREVLKFIDDNLKKTVRFSQNDEGTRIGLPYEYTVPCVSDSFQEMFYWDTYFTNVGLIAKGEINLAKNNTSNILYLVEKYGFMPNGSRTYFLNRSQPPFLSRMVKDVFKATNDKEWLKQAYKTLCKEYSFWQTKRVFSNGLNGYTGYEISDEEIDRGSTGFLNRTGYRPQAEPTYDDKKEHCLAFRSFCESGWDCNSRVMPDAHNFCSVDLNSLLFDLEQNMYDFSCILNNGEADLWEKRKQERLNKMRVLWNENEGIFTDFNIKTNKFSNYKSAASFYPMFVNLATEDEAEKTVKLLEKIELNYGISAGEPEPEYNCQWDYPNIWAPLQFVVYTALKNYGYNESAERIAKKYMKLVEDSFLKTGNLWEKYNGVTGEVMSQEYNAPAMMGWSAGVYLYFNSEIN